MRAPLRPAQPHAVSTARPLLSCRGLTGRGARTQWGDPAAVHGEPGSPAERGCRGAVTLGWVCRRRVGGFECTTRRDAATAAATAAARPRCNTAPGRREADGESNPEGAFVVSRAIATPVIIVWCDRARGRCRCCCCAPVRRLRPPSINQRRPPRQQLSQRRLRLAHVVCQAHGRLHRQLVAACRASQ
jgi:hypothetical protein